MARIRYLKPEFFHDDDLGAMSPLHRLAYSGLWCYADREGRLKDRPRQPKVEILPYDDCDFEQILSDLSKTKPINNTSAFITRYEVAGEKYIQINKFHEHQKPHHTERESVFPPPLTVKERLNNGYSPVGSKRKAKEKEEDKGNSREIDAAFEQFWNLYPKKKAKSDAQKAFAKINPDETLLQTMLSKIKQAMNSEDWLKQKGQFIPYPATWLNKKRWEDEDNGTVKKCNPIAKGLSDYSEYRDKSMSS